MNVNYAAYFNDQRAASQGELQALANNQALLMQQRGPLTISEMMGLGNVAVGGPYSRTVFIPQGWQDWYALGDQLH